MAIDLCLGLLLHLTLKLTANRSQTHRMWRFKKCLSGPITANSVMVTSQSSLAGCFKDVVQLLFLNIFTEVTGISNAGDSYVYIQNS